MRKVIDSTVPYNRLKREVEVFHQRVFSKLDKVKHVSSKLLKVVNDWKNWGMVEIVDNSENYEIVDKPFKKEIEGTVYDKAYWERFFKYGTSYTPKINLDEDWDYLVRRLDLL